MEEGEIFGLLGPNGSGKTTTIRMLASLLKPTEGYARITGYDTVKDSVRVREVIGVLTENPGIYERLTAYQNMKFFAEAYGIEDKSKRLARIKELLEYFNLWDRRNDRTGVFSKGMKQKLAIARALVHKPEIVFLDEPTSGLDPKSSKDIRDLMERLSRQERQTILLSTHRLEDAERLCSRVMIIRNGRSIIVGSINELRQHITEPPCLEIHLKNVNDSIVKSIKSLGLVEEVRINYETNKVFIRLNEPLETTPVVVESIVKTGGLILSVNPIQPSLEEAYLRLTGEDQA